MKYKDVIFGIDFDGTCVTHEFPKVGKTLPYSVEVLKRIVDEGGKLILWTMRCNHTEQPIVDKDQPNTNNPIIECDADNYLDHAKKWFEENNIPLWGCQCNPNQHTWTQSPKAYCHIYIDDAALGCPTMMDKTFSERPYVDWVIVEALLFPEEYN